MQRNTWCDEQQSVAKLTQIVQCWSEVHIVWWQNLATWGWMIKCKKTHILQDLLCVILPLIKFAPVFWQPFLILDVKLKKSPYQIGPCIDQWDFNKISYIQSNIVFFYTYQNMETLNVPEDSNKIHKIHSRLKFSTLQALFLHTKRKCIREILVSAKAKESPV